MPTTSTAAELPAEAAGRRRRADPVLAGAGGPAGNARLTAWTGLVLLALFGAELVTLVDVSGPAGRSRHAGQCATTTGQAACRTSCWPTEPRIRPVKPPRPRAPT
jgi:hypothetical protein